MRSSLWLGLFAVVSFACGGSSSASSSPTPASVDAGPSDGGAALDDRGDGGSGAAADAGKDAAPKPRAWQQVDAFGDFQRGRLAVHATQGGRLALAGASLVATVPAIHVGEWRGASLADRHVTNGADPSALLDLAFVGDDIAFAALGGDPRTPTLGLEVRTAGTWTSRALERPAAGPWPLRQLFASGARLLGATHGMIVDLTGPATTPRTWIFASSEATSVDATFSIAAPTATEGRVLLASSIFRTLRRCTLGAPLACDAPITPAGLPGGDFDAIVDDSAHAVVVASVFRPTGEKELLVSRDAGATFGSLGLLAAGANAFGCDPRDARVLAWREGSTIHLSNDAGATIQTVAGPSAATNTGSLAVDAAGTVWLLDGGGTLFAYR